MILPSDRKIEAGDFFCGMGGATAALYAAAADLGVGVNMVAINHWDVAIKTHEANFPGVRHYCANVGSINPLEAVPGGYLDILLAGPECTHHSRAAGGRPKNKQSRASATELTDFLETLYIRNVLIENVAEWLDWGPLDENGKAIERLKGQYFNHFLELLDELGYEYDWKKVCAADYGDPTTRTRLFLQATRGGRPSWPKPTHHPAKDVHRFPGAKPYVPVRDIIDFEYPSVSIYDRPANGLPELKEATLRRIHTGVRKFSGLPFLVPNFGEAVGKAPRTHKLSDPAPTVTSHGAGCLVQPCLVVLRNNCTVKSVEVPVGALCTEDHFGLAQFMVVQRAHGSGPTGCSHGLESPLRTLTTGGNMALAEPFVVQQAQASEGDMRRCYQLDRPVVTVTTKASLGLVEPFVAGAGGPIGSGRPQPIDNPLGTLLTENHRALVEPHLVHYFLGADVKSLDAPCPTLCATSSHLGLSEFLLRYNGGHGRGQTLESPITTIDTSNRFALCQFVVSYYGTGECVASVADPLATITTRDRFGLVQLVVRPDGHYDGYVVGWLDILFRMLQPHELKRAHSFDEDYVVTGTKEAMVKQIGNSWAVLMGKALITAMLTRPGGMLDALPKLPPLPNREETHPAIQDILDRFDAPVESKAPDLFTVEGLVTA